MALGLTCAAVAPLAAQHVTTPAQVATAREVARAGVPLDDLAPGAPDRYTVKRGDTLWDISRLYLKSPWRWPELWGMNHEQIRNPHLIYPGQVLELDKSGGRATLRVAGSPPVGQVAEGGGIPTVKVSPSTRVETLAEAAIPAISNRVIEPFLNEPLIVDEQALLGTPRIVGTTEHRVMLSRGDRAYALGDGAATLSVEAPRQYRVFRNVVPLKSPETGATLGYEAQYIGKVQMVQPQRNRDVVDAAGKVTGEIVPASLDVTFAKEEIRVGDRLLPEPPRSFVNYVPRATPMPLSGRIVSVHGSAVANAAQRQIVVIDKGTRDGLEVGHVLALQKDGVRVVDRTQGKAVPIKLPDERNGVLLVFRPFDTLSYGLIMEIKDAVRVGDRVVDVAQ